MEKELTKIEIALLLSAIRRLKNRHIASLTKFTNEPERFEHLSERQKRKAVRNKKYKLDVIEGLEQWFKDAMEGIEPRIVLSEISYDYTDLKVLEYDKETNEWEKR